MATDPRVFADVLIPGADEYATASLVAACSVQSPNSSEDTWAMVRALLEQPRSDGAAVWYGGTYPSGEEFYLNIDPGEFRMDRPTGPHDIVLEMPKARLDDSLANRLQIMLNYVETFTLEKGNVNQLIATLTSFRAKDQVPHSGVKMFTDAAKLIQSDVGNGQSRLSNLYHLGLVEHRMPLVHFSAAMALLQLQLITNRWIEPKKHWLFFRKAVNPYLNPYQAFCDFVYSLAATEDRPLLVSALTEMGKIYFNDARASVAAGLNTISMVSHCRSLFAGAHQFWIALMVARINQRLDLNVPLQYRQIQANEGFTCAQTGIMAAVRFLFEHPESEPKRIAGKLDLGITESEIEMYVSSPFWPCFTYTFFQILLAQAKTLRAGPRFEEGLRELLALESKFASASSEDKIELERGWIDSALQNAYMQCGNQEKAQSYAVRIVGKILVQKTLAKSR